MILPAFFYTFTQEPVLRISMSEKRKIENSGLSGFDRKLSGACPNSTVGTGLAIAGTDAQNNQDSVKEKVVSWLAELGYWKAYE